ncbi:hypothetical protein NSP_6150 [Nodularia spumigena CCY9414]|nr:hypothetical protein NSP_6150 [Nodularia spumigena CCY9414]
MHIYPELYCHSFTPDQKPPLLLWVRRGLKFDRKIFWSYLGTVFLRL